MKTSTKRFPAVGGATPKPGRTKPLSTARSRLLVTNGARAEYGYALYKTRDGEYFVKKRIDGVESTTRVSCSVALEILVKETRENVMRLLRHKLREPYLGEYRGVVVDTAKDKLIEMVACGESEVVATYQMADGRKYFRFVSPEWDRILLHKRRGWKSTEKLLGDWVCSEHTFLSHLEDCLAGRIELGVTLNSGEMEVLSRDAGQHPLPWSFQWKGLWGPGQ